MSPEDDITITVDRYKVHAKETVSTGDYESHELNNTIEGEIKGVESMDSETRAYVRRQLLVCLRDLQKTVQQAGENRLAIEDAEDWSDPV